MSQSRDATMGEAACRFCGTEFGQVAKLIPDCGELICLACYDSLVKDAQVSREFKCKACREYHVLSDSGFPEVRQLPRSSLFEAPLCPQAKDLITLVHKVQQELEAMQAFDSRECIEQQCEQLELEVSEAAERASKHIDVLERRMLKQIKEYRQRCLDALNAESSQQMDKIKSQLDVLAKDVDKIGQKWTDYFCQLSDNGKAGEIEEALVHGRKCEARIKKLEQKLRNSALNGSKLRFNERKEFCLETGHLGQLVEISTGTGLNSESEIVIQQMPSLTLTGHSHDVRQVLFLPDSRLASCSFDKTIKLWDTASGQELFTLPGHERGVTSIAMLPNGCLASGSDDSRINVWNLKEKKVRTLQGHTSGVVSLKVLKTGNLVSCSSDNNLIVWDPYLAENNLLLTIRGHGNKSRYDIPFGVLSNDSLVTCSRDEDDREESILRVWDSKDSRLVKSLQTGLKEVRTLLVLSNDQVAIGTQYLGKIEIIDLNNQSKTRARGNAHDLEVSCLLQLSNGNLVSSGWDGTFRSSRNRLTKAWDILVRPGDAYPRIHSIKVWSFYDLALLQNIITDHSRPIRSLSISQEETMLASGSLDNAVKLWKISAKSS